MSTHHSLSQFYLMCLPLSFLAPGTVIFPSLSLWAPCNRGQVPTTLLPSVLQSSTNGAPGMGRSSREPWQVNRMTKSKLFLLQHSSPFAPGTVQTGTGHSNTCASSGSATDSAVVLDPTGCCSVLDSAQALLATLMNICSVHYLEHIIHIIWSRRCTFRAVEGERMCICFKSPETPKFWNGFQDQAFQLWNCESGIKYWVTNIWPRACFCTGNWFHE